MSELLQNTPCQDSCLCVILIFTLKEVLVVKQFFFFCSLCRIGLQRDTADPRTKSFLYFIDLLPRSITSRFSLWLFSILHPHIKKFLATRAFICKTKQWQCYNLWCKTLEKSWGADYSSSSLSSVLFCIVFISKHSILSSQLTYDVWIGWTRCLLLFCWRMWKALRAPLPGNKGIY